MSKKKNIFWKNLNGVEDFNVERKCQPLPGLEPTT